MRNDSPFFYKYVVHHLHFSDGHDFKNHQAYCELPGQFVESDSIHSIQHTNAP